MAVRPQLDTTVSPPLSPAARQSLYSAKDLLNFLGCEHCSALDLQVRARDLPAPEAVDDPYLKLLIEKGNTHERAYLETLRSQGRSIREIARVDSIDEMA